MLEKTNSKRVFKNELSGLGIAVAIGAGLGMTIGFVTTLAQSGVTPDSFKLALAEGAKGGLESGLLAGVGYGIGRTIGEVASNAVAGVLGNKYYICMSDKKGGRVLFNYDESRNIWHKEDNIDIKEFATHNGNLYFIGIIEGMKRLCLADGENLYGNFSGELSGWFLEDDFYWSCETGIWGLSIPENKYFSNIILCLSGEKGTRILIDFQTDESGKWENQISFNANKLGSAVLPFATPRCRFLRIRIRGKGKGKVYLISRVVETGSELNVRP
jgi:hypothetical protein